MESRWLIFFPLQGAFGVVLGVVQRIGLWGGVGGGWGGFESIKTFGCFVWCVAYFVHSLNEAFVCVGGPVFRNFLVGMSVFIAENLFWYCMLLFETLGFLTGSFLKVLLYKLCDLGSVSFCIAHPIKFIAVAWDMIMILAVVVMLLCCDV